MGLCDVRESMSLSDGYLQIPQTRSVVSWEPVTAHGAHSASASSTPESGHPERLRKVLDSYVGHCNGGRPHRGLHLGIPASPPPVIGRVTDDGRTIERTDILGGLIHEYRWAA
jgi:hypothetical protein